MAIIQCLVEAKYMENSQTTQYTAPTGSSRVAIDNLSVTNNSGGSVVIAVNVVASGGAAGATNKVIQDTTLAAGSRLEYLLQGQYLNAGDFISTISDTASAIVLRLNGRVVP
jgi:hypothetical protein